MLRHFTSDHALINTRHTFATFASTCFLLISFRIFVRVRAKRYTGMQGRKEGRETENELFRRRGQTVANSRAVTRVQVQRRERGRGSRVISDIKHEIACRIVRKSRPPKPIRIAEAKSLKRRAVSALAFDLSGSILINGERIARFNPILLRSARSLSPGLSIAI